MSIFFIVQTSIFVRQAMFEKTEDLEFSFT